MSLRLQLAVDEQEPGLPPPVEVDELAILGPFLDESGARGRLDRGEDLSFRAHLDVELAGVGLLVFASRTGVLHDEALHRTSRSQVHLQEQGPVFGAPPVGLPSRHAAVHGLLRPLILAAGHTSGGGTAEREIHPAIGPVDLELVDPGDRLPAVGRTDDVQADEAGFDRRLDHVGRRPRIPGALPDALAPHRPAFLGRLSQPLLHVVDRFSLPDAVHQGRVRQAAPGKPLAPELRLHAVPEEDQRGKERQPVDPERALGEEDTPELDLRDRPRLPGPPGEGKVDRGPRYSPPIRYSYSASTFSSAGTTPSIRWPSSAIRPSARANCSRSRVITSMPIRSSFSLISVT